MDLVKGASGGRGRKTGGVTGGTDEGGGDGAGGRDDQYVNILRLMY